MNGSQFSRKSLYGAEGLLVANDPCPWCRDRSIDAPHPTRPRESWTRTTGCPVSEI
jgi:hypothetical protein